MSWLSSAASAIGGVAGGPLGAIAGNAAGALIEGNQANKGVQKQIDWEETKAKNAHQWEMQDLKAAGLNPILSAGGSGASMGSISAPVIPDYSGAIKSGIDAMNSETNRMNAKTNEGTLGQTKLKTTADVDVAASTAEKNREEAKNLKEGRKNIAADTVLKQKNAGLVSEQAAKTLIDKQNAEIDGNLKEKQNLTYEGEHGKAVIQQGLIEGYKNGLQTIRNSAHSASKLLSKKGREAKQNVENYMREYRNSIIGTNGGGGR